MQATCLDEARKLGLKRVLLTCDPANVASSKVMINNGAVKTLDGIDPETGGPSARYWIEL
jgi:predicted acetyltransferase